MFLTGALTVVAVLPTLDIGVKHSLTHALLIPVRIVVLAQT